MNKLILASASPRRRALLAQLQLPFDVVEPAFDESSIRADSPQELVRLLAAGKAGEVARRYPDRVVIGADTVVVLDGRLLGKPSDPEDAKRMLRALSDKTHTVYTGVAVRHEASGRLEVAHEATLVTFGPLSEGLIDRYVQSGEPMDKAGAYGIQGLGAVFVRRIEGCYFNVVGLPLFRLARLLDEVGVSLA